MSQSPIDPVLQFAARGSVWSPPLSRELPEPFDLSRHLNTSQFSVRERSAHAPDAHRPDQPTNSHTEASQTATSSAERDAEHDANEAQAREATSQASKSDEDQDAPEEQEGASDAVVLSQAVAVAPTAEAATQESSAKADGIALYGEAESEAQRGESGDIQSEPEAKAGAEGTTLKAAGAEQRRSEQDVPLVDELPSTAGGKRAQHDSNAQTPSSDPSKHTAPTDQAPDDTHAASEAEAIGESKQSDRVHNAERSARPIQQLIPTNTQQASAIGPAMESAAALTQPVRDSGENKQESRTGSATNRIESLAAALGRGPSSGGVGPGSATDANSGLPRIDAARFVGRVAKALVTAQERGGSLQLRLSPPELGSLRLEIAIRDGALNASVETESSTTRRVLLDHLPALRERLAEQNIRIERFDVDVRRDGNEGQAQEQAARHEQAGGDERRQAPARRTPERAIQPAVADSDALPGAHVAITDKEINLVV